MDIGQFTMCRFPDGLRHKLFRKEELGHRFKQGYGIVNLRPYRASGRLPREGDSSNMSELELET